MLLQGRTEFLEKHAPVAQALAARGFAVASVDWRGQGGSARALPNPRKGHVETFAAYGLDLDALLSAPEIAAAAGPRLMVAHSMGGCVGLRALLRPDPGFAAAVFSAPMWGLAQGRALGRLARGLSRAAVALGLGGRYAPGGGDAPLTAQGFAGNPLTGDGDEFARIAALTAANPALALGGPTWAWVRAAYAEIDALAPARCPVPALVALGGAEGVVSPAAIRRRAARDGMRLVELPGARHEPLFEAPPLRARLWAEIDGFLAERGL